MSLGAGGLKSSRGVRSNQQLGVMGLAQDEVCTHQARPLVVDPQRLGWTWFRAICTRISIGYSVLAGLLVPLSSLRHALTPPPPPPSSPQLFLNSPRKTRSACQHARPRIFQFSPKCL